MGTVKFTQQAENERIAREQAARKSWSILETPSLVKATQYAREIGWKENKVQVRGEPTTEGMVYYVEPYEEGCGCRGILKYREFFE